MSKICQITGAVPKSGNNKSKSNRKTKRRFLPNLKWKRIFDEVLNKFIRIRVSTRGLRTLTKKLSKKEERALERKELKNKNDSAEAKLKS